ncbi:MAG: OmpA family protein [Marinibacterium sp.]
MNRLSMHICAILMSSLALGAAPAAAQSTEMTAEEITEAFKKQKTRGLVLVPATGTESTTETAPGAATGTTTAAAEPGATIQAEDVTTVYHEVAPDTPEVSIQIAFDFNSAALRGDQKPKLDTLCSVMQNIDVAVFQIIGHTDSSGPADYNQRLSLLRAQEVKRHLVNDCGIAETRLRALGVGETAPLNSADPRADENRRVEFQALG